jgi:argininosuccinate lyase
MMTNRSTNLWGGRFTGPPDETFRAFNDSFRFDLLLFAADVRASIAHAAGLGRAGVLSAAERATITDGLQSLLATSGSEDGFFTDDAEDVHSFIESRLVEIVGDVGKKLHTGRSRNDQVATAFRLWLRDEIDEVLQAILVMQRALVDLGERHRDAVLPGYTHLQRAQPILWPHWCLAYFEMYGEIVTGLATCEDA